MLVTVFKWSIVKFSLVHVVILVFSKIIFICLVLMDLSNVYLFNAIKGLHWTNWHSLELLYLEASILQVEAVRGPQLNRSEVFRFRLLPLLLIFKVDQELKHILFISIALHRWELVVDILQLRP